MPLLKPIAGHTGCAGIKHYLEKGGRALGIMVMNFAWQEERAFEDVSAAPAGFDWADSMDATRRACGNDTPYRGKPARTFKHFVMSPDPQDGLTADQVAELASAWALRHFADFEAAIVLHDDNERRIPHAHIVVNNTNLATERRLQTPDPLELNRSLQDLAEERGYRFMRNDTVREEDEGQTRKATPATLQSVYMRRAEREIQKEGGYSWVADIRNRVTVAKALARNEDEFMAVLEALEVDVSQNSEKSWRRDWIYSLSDHPTWRIGGEKLGLSFGQAALRRRLAPSPGGIPTDTLRSRKRHRAERPVGAGTSRRRDRGVHVRERAQPGRPRQEDRKARRPRRRRFRRTGGSAARGARIRGGEQAPARNRADKAAKAAAGRGSARQARRRETA